MATLQKWISLYPKEKTMKKSIFVVALLALTACGSKTVYVTSTEAPDTTVKVTKTTDAPIATPAPTQPPVAWSDEEEFIADIYNENTGPIYLEDQDLIDAGYAVCDGLRSGMTGYDALDAIVSSSEGDTAVEELLINVTASAVVNFCPEQAYKFGE
jgi:hypothetical protein